METSEQKTICFRSAWVFYFPVHNVEQGMTRFQIVPTLTSLRKRITVKQRLNLGKTTAMKQGHGRLEHVEPLFGYNEREIESFTRNRA